MVCRGTAFPQSAVIESVAASRCEVAPVVKGRAFELRSDFHPRLDVVKDFLCTGHRQVYSKIDGCLLDSRAV